MGTERRARKRAEKNQQIGASGKMSYVDPASSAILVGPRAGLDVNQIQSGLKPVSQFNPERKVPVTGVTRSRRVIYYDGIFN